MNREVDLAAASIERRTNDVNIRRNGGSRLPHTHRDPGARARPYATRRGRLGLLNLADLPANHRAKGGTANVCALARCPVNGMR